MLGVLRIAAARPLLRAGVRLVHTTAVARAQSLGPQNPAPERVKPASPAYFTTKPSYIDTLQMLDQLTREVKRELEQSYILPLNSKPPPLPQGPTNIWITREVLHSRLGINLRASQYRSVISRLTLLLRYRALVLENFTDAKASAFAERSTAHQRELASKVEEVFGEFMSTHGKAQDAQEKRTTPLRTSTRGYIDEQGRAYARGRRKESSARVWLVPAKDAETTLGAVLVNGAPLSQYFTRTQHREQVVWPLKLAGVLGQYNIFALTRGGGQSGQAGAIAHGIANALVAQLASVSGDEASAVHEHVKHLLAKGAFLSHSHRWHSQPRPAYGGAQEAGSGQGAQGIHLGQALVAAMHASIAQSILRFLGRTPPILMGVLSVITLIMLRTCSPSLAMIARNTASRPWPKPFQSTSIELIRHRAWFSLMREKTRSAAR